MPRIVATATGGLQRFLPISRVHLDRRIRLDWGRIERPPLKNCCLAPIRTASPTKLAATGDSRQDFPI
jgi:hypothetical protein